MRLFLFLGIVSLSLTSCAIKNDYVDVQHKRSKKTTSIHHPNKKPIQVEVRDEREDKEQIGYKENSLGMKTAKILPKEDLSVSLTRAIQDELIAKGFVVSEGGLKLLVTLEKCFVDYERNLFFARSIADLQLDIHVLSEDGDPLFFKRMSVQGKESPIFMYSGKNAAKAVSKALDKVLLDLTLDQHFIGSLVGETTSDVIAKD